MTLSPEVLASLADCPLDWELLPLNGSKRPVDPETGQLLSNWSTCGTDVEGITAIAGSTHVKAVGLLLGPQSGGVLAVDFDGVQSFPKFCEVFGHQPEELPPSMAVTSGREQRCCLFFAVDREYWPLLKGREVWSDANDKTCLELRWTGHQQVIAGAHPETAGYSWVISPSLIPLPPPAPDWLLEPLVRKERQVEPYVPVDGDAERALEMLACLPPADFQSYDRWLEVGMALHSVDPGLLSAWVDWSRGMDTFEETECLLKWESFKGGGVTIATLHHHAKAYGYRSTPKGGGVPDVGKIPEPDFAAAEGGPDVGKITNPRWVIRDFLARGLMVLGAEMGSGKTSLIYHCCESVQQGTLFLDQLPTTQGRCLVIQGDEPEADARDKFHLMGIAPSFEIVFRDVGQLDLKWLEQMITSGRYDVICVDSIGSLLASDDLEVTDQGMSRVIYPLNRLFVDHGVAGIFTHHLNKPKDGMLRKTVTHHDFGGCHNILSAVTDLWSICHLPDKVDSFDLRCHGKRKCRKGTVFHLTGDEEDYSWILASTSDGLLPQERLHLEKLILHHFNNDPTPLHLEQLAQALGTSYEHTRRVALDLFTDNERITRSKVQSGGRGRPKYLYRPAA
jgi:hypothetical protein